MGDLANILTKIDQFAKDGVPFKVSVEDKTLQTAGGYIVGGLALQGVVIGALISVTLYLIFRNR
jgi:hypothetical protein